jgi:hypothetical protein
MAIPLLSQPCHAAAATPPVFPTPAGTARLPVVLYEVDYATSGPIQSQTISGTADTIVAIGLPQADKPDTCNIQVAWYDWDGHPAGLSGPVALAGGQTLEFTSSTNTALPTEYPPFIEHVFRSSSAAFEGYAQITTDTACLAKRLRVDAGFVTNSQVIGGKPADSTRYKEINVTSRLGLAGD